MNQHHTLFGIEGFSFEQWQDNLLLTKVPKDSDSLTYYKITDKQWKTANCTIWGINKTVTSSIKSFKGKLCNGGWIHAYTHPILAGFLNPIFGNDKEGILWRWKGDVGVVSDVGIVGCHSFTTTSVSTYPMISSVDTIKIALTAASDVYFDQEYQSYMDDWLKDKCRSFFTARKLAGDIIKEMSVPPYGEPYVKYKDNAKFSAFCALRACEIHGNPEENFDCSNKIKKLSAAAAVYAKAAASLHETLKVDIVKILEKVLAMK